MQHTDKWTWWLDCLVLSLLVSGTYALFLGMHPFTVPDGGRYVEIPREMLARHDFITPYLNGIKYFEKPPLFYWLQCLSLHAFGLNEWSARIVTAVIAVLGCVGCYSFTRHIYTRQCAWFASITLATCLLYFAMGHLVTLDMTVSVLISLSLFSFFIGFTRESRLAFYGFYLFAGLAVLTKGLIGFAFPAMIIGLWILLLNQWRVLLKMCLPTGLVLFAAIIIPWHVLVQAKHPEFFQYYVMDQQLLRYATNIAGRTQPNWFFIPVLLLGLFPWVFFLPQAIYYHLPRQWKLVKYALPEMFLLIWAISIFAFYSFSHSKLVPYILPVIPPLAILIGHYLADAAKRDSTTIGANIGFSFLLPFAIGFVFLFPKIPTLSPMVDGPHAMPYLIFCAIVLSITALVVLRRHVTSRFTALSLGCLLFYLGLIAGMRHLDTRSIKPLALTINRDAKPSAEIFSYVDYYQDLAPYTKRRINIVDWRNELAFGLAHQPEAAEWMIDTPTFIKRWTAGWKNGTQMFMIARIDRYQTLAALYPTLPWVVLKQTKHDILVTNESPTLSRNQRPHCISGTVIT
ncbi:MAG: glycosyl transferase [marine bacterium B5-7]|nr:MAG: glycosyl transferase [marine bacterium B5-7]